jgi:hypothetical protein
VSIGAQTIYQDTLQVNYFGLGNNSSFGNRRPSPSQTPWRLLTICRHWLLVRPTISIPTALKGSKFAAAPQDRPGVCCGALSVCYSPVLAA